MGYLHDRIVIISSFVLISYTFLAKADMKITVDKDNCGGSMNIDTIQKLYLNYYGAEFVDTESKYYSHERVCLFNISSSLTDSEICIYNKHHTSWDIACGSSLSIYIGNYHSVHFPSMYHCTDFEPLCTSKERVFLQFYYDRALHIMEKDIVVEFVIYLKNNAVTTIRPRTSTSLPSLSGDSEDGSGLSTVWIIVIAGGAAVLLFCCCSCVYYICRDDESDEQSQSQNNSPDDVNTDSNAENMRMLVTPVIHIPHENRHQSTADPPDYYTVCSDGPSQYKPNILPFNTSDPADEKVIPSAPPPPYPGI
ncbi:uncharacterized protein LOC123564194 [Mercenaria mercenaria]|uniref:uncharacterized protein LOC123564194 n=1 Tax=Mercenaria mercenaria TaxID=6596 RepID=UPI00234F7D5A|nr:uncharacterized protein LOC123564194 [Mercenaria mercenaria]XP_045213503.2 uncharacterized protein LOC123564194 [Mercenaria mercenaria]XP_053392814.1 uncharacterized protein LOC123564194 [Mercenaria mercenaria]